MKLIKVTAGWYESSDGRFTIVRQGTAVWAITSDGQNVSQVCRSKREAAAEVARRLTQEQTHA